MAPCQAHLSRSFQAHTRGRRLSAQPVSTATSLMLCTDRPSHPRALTCCRQSARAGLRVQLQAPTPPACLPARTRHPEPPALQANDGVTEEPRALGPKAEGHRRRLLRGWARGREGLLAGGEQRPGPAGAERSGSRSRSRSSVEVTQTPLGRDTEQTLQRTACGRTATWARSQLRPHKYGGCQDGRGRAGGSTDSLGPSHCPRSLVATSTVTASLGPASQPVAPGHLVTCHCPNSGCRLLPLPSPLNAPLSLPSRKPSQVPRGHSTCSVPGPPPPARAFPKSQPATLPGSRRATPRAAGSPHLPSLAPLPSTQARPGSINKYVRRNCTETLCPWWHPRLTTAAPAWQPQTSVT
ncbi:uncharacterized protein [Vulpes vulpes]|uniref:Uncharacterized protein n=1 Tax=Vulpes vulpes TaxID=9627 RepID=A0ABM4XAM1_VULVU